MKSSNGNSRGIKRQAEAMFSKHKLWVVADFQGILFWTVIGYIFQIREADWTYRILHMRKYITCRILKFARFIS